MEQLKTKQGLEDEEWFQMQRPETLWEIHRRTNITAKELQP